MIYWEEECGHPPTTQLRINIYSIDYALHARSYSYSVDSCYSGCAAQLFRRTWSGISTKHIRLKAMVEQKLSLGCTIVGKRMFQNSADNKSPVRATAPREFITFSRRPAFTVYIVAASSLTWELLTSHKTLEIMSSMSLSTVPLFYTCMLCWETSLREAEYSDFLLCELWTLYVHTLAVGEQNASLSPNWPSICV